MARLATILLLFMASSAAAEPRVYASAKTKSDIGALADMILELSGRRRDVLLIAADEKPRGYEDVKRLWPDYPKLEAFEAFDGDGDLVNALSIVITNFVNPEYASGIIFSPRLYGKFRFRDDAAPEVDVLSMPPKASPKESAARFVSVAPELLQKIPGNADDWFFLVIAHETNHLDQEASICAEGDHACALSNEAVADRAALRSYSDALRRGFVHDPAVPGMLKDLRLVASVLSPIDLSHATGPFLEESSPDWRTDPDGFDHRLRLVLELKKHYVRLFKDPGENYQSVMENYAACPAWHARAFVDSTRNDPDPEIRSLVSAFDAAARRVFLQPEDLPGERQKLCANSFSTLLAP